MDTVKNILFIILVVLLVIGILISIFYAGYEGFQGGESEAATYINTYMKVTESCLCPALELAIDFIVDGSKWIPVEGVTYDDEPYKTVTANSFEECSSFCEKDKDCKLFTFNESKCNLKKTKNKPLIKTLGVPQIFSSVPQGKKDDITTTESTGKLALRPKYILKGGSDQEKRKEALKILEKKAKGKIFKCPIPSCVEAVPSDIGYRILNTINLLKPIILSNFLKTSAAYLCQPFPPDPYEDKSEESFIDKNAIQSINKKIKQYGGNMIFRNDPIINDIVFEDTEPLINEGFVSDDAITCKKIKKCQERNYEEDEEETNEELKAEIEAEEEEAEEKDQFGNPLPRICCPNDKKKVKSCKFPDSLTQSQKKHIELTRFVTLSQTLNKDVLDILSKMKEATKLLNDVIPKMKDGTLKPVCLQGVNLEGGSKRFTGFDGGMFMGGFLKAMQSFGTGKL